MRQRKGDKDYGQIVSISEGLSKLAKIEGISFWAHQFSEHFKFILAILKAEKEEVSTTPELRTKLRGMQARWALISEDPRLYEDEDSERTLELKEEVKELISSLDCIPDLLTHMIEEVDYFKNSVVAEEYTLKDEVAWWATEHAENLDFVNCQLPILIRNEGDDRWPAFLHRALEANKELSQEFKEIAYNNRAGFLAGIGRAFGLAGSSEIDPRDLDNFMRLKEEHIDGINELMIRIPELPLSPCTQKDLFEMLDHERNEAVFAFDRIRSYSDFEK